LNAAGGVKEQTGDARLRQDTRGSPFNIVGSGRTPKGRNGGWDRAKTERIGEKREEGKGNSKETCAEQEK